MLSCTRGRGPSDALFSTLLSHILSPPLQAPMSFIGKTMLGPITGRLGPRGLETTVGWAVKWEA